MKRHIVLALMLLGCSSSTVPESIVPASVTILHDGFTLDGIGTSIHLVAVARDSSGRAVPATFVWGSSNPQAVRISKSGLVTAIGCGWTTITATAQNVTGVVNGFVTVPASDPRTETFASALDVDIPSMTRLFDGLYIKDVIVGSGTLVTQGMQVSARLTAWHPNGRQVQGLVPVAMVLAGDRNAAWSALSHAVLGMRTGGKRRVVAGSAHTGWNGPYATPCPSTQVIELEMLS